MDGQEMETREELVERIKPSNCQYCGSKRMVFEVAHFPRFFYSCQTCEMRTELVYNWHTNGAKAG